MRATWLAGFILVSISAGQAAEWRAQRIDTPARVGAIEAAGTEAHVEAGGLWYALTRGKDALTFRYVERAQPEPPASALPDGHVATGTRDIARVWLSDPTGRYGHGVLGDRTEAGSVTIETRDGKRHIVALGGDAVFEDLRPRLADLDSDGHDEVVVVKSYLKRGAALAVIAARKGRYQIVAESTPLGSANRWLDPAGIADFLGDGRTSIALVRQPHVVGQLEIWTFHDGRLSKTAELPGFTNHIIGSRAIGMSVVADFDGDGVADLALPSLDRTRLRIVSFAPKETGPREIASIPLPSKAVTDLALVGGGPPFIALGLADGSLAVARPAR